MNRKICVVTGTRAEYGLLRWVMTEIVNHSGLSLQTVVTGMHLSPEFGLTYREIEADGFRIDKRVETLLSSDTSVGIAKAIGLGVIGFADALAELSPDVLLVLGDRFEILAAVAAALVARIPVAHVHGGEATEGLIDESMRHSITKMSHLHFVAAAEYARRVIQLGEQPDRVFNVGGVGIDNIRRLRLMDRAELENALGFRLGIRNLLVTFHPVTLEDRTAADQMGELLAALDDLTDTHLIFTMPNADTGGRVLINLVERFVAGRPDRKAFTSLGQVRYLSTVQHVDGVVGNSSSGLTEVPSFRKATIDIGDRQRGRLRAGSVVNCAPTRQAIASALRQIYEPAFQERVTSVSSPYGEGGASERIVATLATVSLEGILKKQFFDLPAL